MNHNLANVAVLFGGNSNEYEVSLKSAASVIDHLDRNKYHIIMVGITRDGQWLMYNGNTEDIRNDCWHSHPSCLSAIISPSKDWKGLIAFKNTEFTMLHVDIVFPILHGKYGEDGTVQGLLELSGIPYVGCDMLSSAICMDKDIAHTLVQAIGIDTPSSITILDHHDIESTLIDAEKLGFPLYVKPAKSGSSIGISKVSSRHELTEGIHEALFHDKKVVIEKNIDGFEVGCAILGHTNPIVGEIDEIEISESFFNYKEKYSLSTSTIHLPARIDMQTAKKIKETALKIYHMLGCRGFARVDMFVTADGRIVFNEVNTIPGFTATSRYPNMIQSIGITFPELLDRLIELAVTEV